jgi:hypothetical protein
MTPVVHLELQISPQVFEKMRNGPNGILKGLEETDVKKTRSRKFCGTVPLIILFSVIKNVFLYIRLTSALRTESCSMWTESQEHWTAIVWGTTLGRWGKLRALEETVSWDKYIFLKSDRALVNFRIFHAVSIHYLLLCNPIFDPYIIINDQMKFQKNVHCV